MDLASYAEKHNVFGMLEDIVRQLVIEQPADPLAFIKQALQQPPMPQVIVHGPPAAGCATLAQQLAQKLNAVLVHGPTAVQQAAAEGTKVGLKIKGHMTAGTPVPSVQITKCIMDRLQQADCRRKGWVLYGFPATRAEAEALQMEGLLCSHYLLLEAPDAVLMGRYPGKRVDPATGAIYHEIYKPAPANVNVVKISTEDDASMQAKLAQYRREVLGLEAAYKATVRHINADQAQPAVFAEAWHHICKQKKSNAPIIPRLSIMGPPGSGKSSVARFLAQSYNCVLVYAPDLLRKEVAAESKLGATLKPYLERNLAVPDNVYTRVVVERLQQQDCVTRGWVLDAYPESRAQAELLCKEGFQPSRTIFLEVAATISLERLCQRRVDPMTGQWYHQKTAPAPTVSIMNRLVQHPKDTEAEVQKRMTAYAAMAPELQQFYPEAQTITTDRDMEDVYNMAEAHLVAPVKAK